MRVYFLSYLPAILKLNGMFIGTIDGFERRIELDPANGVFAEIIPDNNLQPVNFFLNEKFFSSPPAFAEVYLMDGDALINIREYGAKDVKLNVVCQTRFCGNLITVFSQGGVYLSAEGEEYDLSPLPLAFADAGTEVKTLAGREVLAIKSNVSSHLLLISDRGKKIFLNPVESAEFGETLKITAAFETCTAAKAEFEFAYDGERLTLTASKTVETRPPEEDILHFAFFESVLTRGNCVNYLSDELKPRANDLKSYLGEFISVTVPPEKFYLQHGKIKAAGLVYPLSENLYRVKYFAVDVENGKIANIYPVQ